MSFRNVSIGRLLRAMYADRGDRIAVLRDDIRTEIRKESGFRAEGGGDFYVPFWADAKQHVSGAVHLNTATQSRIDANGRRGNLYPKLQDGFLRWWQENRRLRNEPFTIIEQHVKATRSFPNLGDVRIENTLSFTIGTDGHRIVVPYFYEDPPISDEMARLSLWLMSDAISEYDTTDMRILDVMRARSFSTVETPLRGDEEALFTDKFRTLLADWDRLRSEYPP